VLERDIGVAEGALGVRTHPGRRKNIWARNLQGKVVSTPPRQNKSAILGIVLLGGVYSEGGSG